MVELQQIKTGFVADDFFLMANDDPSGRPRLSERILALGLAGALLCELILTEAAALEKGNLMLTANRRPRHLLHAALCGEVEAEEEPRPVRDWLDYLSLQSIDRVGRRLRAAGVVQFQQPRLKMPGRTGRWLPVDVQTANWPAVDVTRKIYNGKATASDLVLFGLTRASGLDNPALWEIRHLLTDPALLEQTLKPLAVFNPLLVDLLAHTQAAVGSAVTSQRRG
ncbi:GOLPH3/VPS74 family protein [Catenulispora pinisilvae]|uniref:GOLPH3/VPS74 family protein n=1 Tax=Catenulispora pinisilvae TaxID=2705253 RepID=UPI001892026A|nr:GPP34 family phosphoprotein [Catenulispora pinisilvae]